MVKRMTTSILFLSIAMLAAGLFAAANSPAATMPDELTAFYDEYIDNKIEQSDMEASRITGTSAVSQCSAALHQTRAEYHAVYKEDLIEQMVEREDIGMSPAKIDYFLVDVFSKTNPRVNIAVCQIETFSG
jgi:hypothetical protein